MAESIQGKGKGSAHSWLGKLRGSGAEAKALAAAERAERLAAPRILRPNEVQGEYDAGRVLMTTLGGNVRVLTHEDLAAFRHNIRTTAKKFKPGLTARQVIDLSLPIDRERANQHIRTAVPVRADNGTVRFMTNAGPDSEVSRHHVTVEFLSYGAAAASGAREARKMALWLRKQPLKFDCDCGRHRFWYRYLATIGQFNAGRAETGYPKIRNPHLYGVACKHVLRVMAEIERGGAVLAFLGRLLEKAKAHDEAKASLRHTQQDAERLARNQSRRTSGAEIKTSADKAEERQKRALAKAAQGAPKPTRAAGGTRRGHLSQEQVALMAQFGLSPEQIAQIAAATTTTR